jgi:hypothetical protein
MTHVRTNHNLSYRAQVGQSTCLNWLDQYATHPIGKVQEALENGEIIQDSVLFCLV